MNKLSLLIISLMIGAATSAMYSLQPDFTVTFQQTPNQLAHCYYDLKHNTEGWNYLKIYANLNVDLITQHQAAGYLEGYLTYKQINYAYFNWESVILGGKQLSPKVVNFLNDQIDFIDSMVQAHPKDLYWQYAGAKIQQLRYMYRGFLTRLHMENRLDLMLSWTQFYAITNVGDLQDLVGAFQYSQQQQKEQNSSPKTNLKMQTQGNCNGIVKLIDGKLYVAHSTHNKYEFMLRIFKTYNFPTRDARVGSETITFSSRPGDLISKDDFYVLSSGLIVIESSLGNMNDQNWKQLSPQTVPTWLRQTIACHLAKTSDQWLNYFLKDRSGTHNNQWVIVDPKNLDKNKHVVTYVEEAFSIYDVIDVTDLLFSQGYVPTYNMPKSRKIYDKLGYAKCTFIFISAEYSYDNDPRALIFKKLNPMLNTVEDMKKWLIANEEASPAVGLAPRYDLLQSKPVAFGLTDCKIVTPNTMKQNFVWAISGPTTSNGRFPPFDWSKWGNHSHLGMPDKFDFPWVKVTIHDTHELQGLENEQEMQVKQM